MTDVTRSMEATSRASAARVQRRRGSLPSGVWGMLLLIATEATLFASLIAAYFYLRFQAADWPVGDISRPSVVLPLVFTGMLVATAVPVFAAGRATRAGLRGRAWLLLAAATVVQATYLGLQIWLFAGDVREFAPDTNAYSSIYFTLLALDHAHVAVGLVFSAWLLAKLSSRITNYRLVAMRAIALYWYFAIVTTVLVTLTTLYPSL
jgi:heme/copper-type cytochrome/quinol oxidase subunit 3